MIRNSHARVLAGLVAATAIVMVTSCGTDNSAAPSGNVGKGLEDFLDQAGSAAATPPSGAPTGKGSSAPTAAAFAGCPITWQDFPEGVRPAAGGEGEPVPGNPAEGYDEACQYDHPDGTSFSDPEPTGKPYFGVRVYLGKSRELSAEPGSEEASWAGSPGYTKQFDRNGADVCVAAVELGDGGVGGIAVIAQNWPKPVDTCETADHLMTVLTS